MCIDVWCKILPMMMVTEKLIKIAEKYPTLLRNVRITEIERVNYTKC